MKKLWHKISLRIDSRTLRERTILFGLIAAMLVFCMYFLVLNPNYSKQTELIGQLNTLQASTAAVDAEITHTLLAFSADPDAAEKVQLAALLTEVEGKKSAITSLERGMVPASGMSALLGRVLQSHRNLRLMSMRSLGEVPLSAEPAAPAPAPAAAPVAATAGQLLHKHGFELVLEGSYADMVAYMSALENMQGKILWSSSHLNVDKYPAAQLTLVVHTINLDKKWIKL